MGVSFLSFLGMIITLLVSVLVPIGAAVIFGVTNKGKGVWKAWLLGAAGFILLQVLIRIPVLNILSMFHFFQKFTVKHYVIYCLLLAFSAALFEVIARFGVAKILQKKMNFQQGVAAGLGHGGIEAIILIGATYISNIILAIMINMGVMQNILHSLMTSGADMLTIQQYKGIIYTLSNTPSCDFYLAGYERILAMILHVAMSLLVCYFVYKKKAVIGVGIAFVIHFLVDFIAPLINGMTTYAMGKILSQGAAYGIIYTFLTFMGIVSIAIIVVIGILWKREKKNEAKEL